MVSKRKSAGESIAAQAKKLQANVSVISLATTCIDKGVDEKTGMPTLHAVFPQPNGRAAHRCNLTFLLKFSALTNLFSAAFLAWGTSMEPNTRVHMAQTLRAGFFAFLSRTYGTDLTPKDIDDEVLLAFRAHLNLAKTKRGTALSAGSVRQALGSIRGVLYALETGPQAAIAQRIAAQVPAGPIGASLQVVPTEVLSLDDLLHIMEAAEREVLAVDARLAETAALIASGDQKLADPKRIWTGTRADYREIDVALARLKRLYPGVVPDLPVIKKNDKNLGDTVQFLASNRGGSIDLRRYLYPSARDLIPFAVLITASTVFNADTALGLEWSRVDMKKEKAGIPAIEIIGEKNRASRNLVRLLDPESGVSSSVSLKRLLELLRAFTSPIRPFVHQDHKDRLFIFVQERRAKQPKSWGREGAITQSPTSDMTWFKGLNGFIQAHQLRPFALGQLRHSVLNLVQSLDGSLEVAAKIGNHGSVRTTWTHYTSDGVRKQYRERVGQVLLLRERWFDSQGSIDPRRRMAAQDAGASTAGFICLDPFDSPRPNQQKGKLCNDYGGCPSCPLAGAKPDDPVSVAHYTSLEKAIYLSQTAMSPKTWVSRWVPVLSDLKALLSLVPIEVLEASRKVVIKAPLVG